MVLKLTVVNCLLFFGWVGAFVAGSRRQFDTMTKGLLLLLSFLLPSSTCAKVLTGEVLWDGASDIHRKIWLSPFISEACSGDLDVLEFSQYMVQDIGCFMPGVIKVLHGLQDRSLKEQGTSGNLTVYFCQLHSRYVTYLAEEGSGWHLQNVTCSNSCQAYVDFLGDVARNEPLEQSVIAFAPCTVLWEWLGWKMSSCKGLSKNAYKTWIAGLGGKSSIVHQIDITSYPVQQSMKTFRAAMIHELDFFNSVSSHAPLATTTLATATSDSEGWYFLVVLVLGISLVATWAMAAWRKVKAEPLERHLLNI